MIGLFGKSSKDKPSFRSVLPKIDIVEGLRHYCVLPHQERIGKRTRLPTENFIHIADLLKHLEKREPKNTRLQSSTSNFHDSMEHWTV